MGKVFYLMVIFSVFFYSLVFYSDISFADYSGTVTGTDSSGVVTEMVYLSGSDLQDIPITSTGTYTQIQAKQSETIGSILEDIRLYVMYFDFLFTVSIIFIFMIFVLGNPKHRSSN